MKLTNVIGGCAFLSVLAFAPVVAKAQSNQTSTTVKQDKSATHKDEDKLAADRALRAKDEKSGHPNQAVKEEKAVQTEKKDIKADKKETSEDKSKATPSATTK